MDGQSYIGSCSASWVEGSVGIEDGWQSDKPLCMEEGNTHAICATISLREDVALDHILNVRHYARTALEPISEYFRTVRHTYW